MSDLEGSLIELERGFWLNGPDYYADNLADESIFVFREMAGRFSRADIEETIDSAARWSEVSITTKGVLQPAENLAILAYHAEARRGPQIYAALASSAYLLAGGRWRLVFHQQTPLA
jgi:hypothetical protein